VLSVADQLPKNARGTLRHASSDITIYIYTLAQNDAKRKQWFWMVGKSDMFVPVLEWAVSA
jgi:hypothetical protein